MTDLSPMQQDARTLLDRMAMRYGVEPVAFEITMAEVAMPRKNGAADFRRSEMVSCLMIANEHNLNPLTREIYFMRTKSGQVMPIVSVDGWMKKLNEHPQFDGIEFEDQISEDGELISITCIVYRKDRSRPIKVTEYLTECRQDTGPWKKTPARMLRHRSLTQAARYAVGFAGVMDRDEFDQWQAGEAAPIALEAAADLPEIPDIPDLDIDQDPPIADEAGFLHSLEESLAAADTPELVEEIRESNQHLIDRCSDRTQHRIAELFEQVGP